MAGAVTHKTGTGPASSRYDVIIAGAGPAGSTAGYILSKAGLNVLLIDKSTFPRPKLCAGLLTHKTVSLLERVFGETADYLKKKDIINYESAGYEICSRNALIARQDSGMPFYFVNRDRYDHYLLNKALHAGAGLVEGDGIAARSLNVLKNTVTTESGRTFAADFIIGADGVNSRVRRSFPVNLFGIDDWKGNLASAHEIFVNRETVRKQIDRPRLYFGYIDWGYAWIFPNRDRLKIGICALNRKNNRKDILPAFRKFLHDTGFHAPNEEISSYVLPYGSYLPIPVFRNVMLAGDAAGFADPLFGEGIFFAQRSAELLAQSITDNVKTGYVQAGEQYVNLLTKHIHPEFAYAAKIRHVLFTYLSRFHYIPLKAVMAVFGNMPIEAVHGIRSYRWFRRIVN